MQRINKDVPSVHRCLQLYLMNRFFYALKSPNNFITFLMHQKTQARIQHEISSRTFQDQSG